MALGASAASYLTGNRVYNGGTNNPTSGTVDPSGYISRELKKKKQSKRRSGLAQTALRLQKQRQATSATIKPPVSPVQFGNLTSLTHTVQPNATGQLQAIPIQQPQVQQTSDPMASSNVLPFDSQSAAQQLLMQKQNDDFMNSLNMQRQQLGSDITNQERNVDLAAPGRYRNLINNFANRGMANSSGYGYQYGVTADDIANQKADLERQLQEGLANFDYQQQQQANDYQLALAQLNAQTAESMPQDEYTGISGPQTQYQKITKTAKPKTQTKAKKQAAAKRIAAKNKNKKGGKK